MVYADVVSLVGRALEMAGLVVIVAGASIVAIRGIAEAIRPACRELAYRRARHGVGRAILLGLELLVGADIVRTVAERPTLATVTVLAGIVLIRTFLSFTLEVELEGRWPWRREQPDIRGRTA